MLKLISLLKRADGVSKDEFRTWVTEDHAPFARALPGLRRYVVNVTVDDDEFLYDAVNEMWFDSEEAFTAAYETDIGKRVAADSLVHVSRRERLLVSEVTVK